MGSSESEGGILKCDNRSIVSKGKVKWGGKEWNYGFNLSMW